MAICPCYRAGCCVRVILVACVSLSAQRLGEDYSGPKPVSKKEQQRLLEEKRQKKGARLRKTGPKANKFDAEAAGKKKNKKNGLYH